jgi:hypothetical protein
MPLAPPDSVARGILAQSNLLIGNARTLHYTGIKTSPDHESAGTVTRQQYYFSNDSGTTRIRVESSAEAFGMNLATLFITDQDGVWEVLSDHVVEVSTVFPNDALPGVYPFFRFLLCLDYPYELVLNNENHNGAEHWLIKGALSNPPDANGPDMAREFTYRIAKNNHRLQSIHERTFANRFLDVTFNKFELNQSLDPQLFELPSARPRTTIRTMNQYLESRNQEIAKLLRS